MLSGVYGEVMAAKDSDERLEVGFAGGGGCGGGSRAAGGNDGGEEGCRGEGGCAGMGGGSERTVVLECEVDGRYCKTGLRGVAGPRLIEEGGGSPRPGDRGDGII